MGVFFALTPSEFFMVIELKNIVKRFGQNTVVNHVDLTIGDGEFFTLLGPSGCGKTTLLRMIAGFNDPDEGDILFIEEPPLAPYKDRVDRMIVYDFGETYPLDVTLDITPAAIGLHSVSVTEFAGKAHKIIKKEIFER